MSMSKQNVYLICKNGTCITVKKTDEGIDLHELSQQLLLELIIFKHVPTSYVQENIIISQQYNGIILLGSQCQIQHSRCVRVLTTSLFTISHPIAIFIKTRNAFSYALSINIH